MILTWRSSSVVVAVLVAWSASSVSVVDAGQADFPPRVLMTLSGTVESVGFDGTRAVAILGKPGESLVHPGIRRPLQRAQPKNDAHGILRGGQGLADSRRLQSRVGTSPAYDDSAAGRINTSGTVTLTQQRVAAQASQGTLLVLYWPDVHGHVALIDVLTGAQRVIADIREPYFALRSIAAWSPDGKLIAVISGSHDSIRLFSAGGRLLRHRPIGTSVSEFAWAPDSAQWSWPKSTVIDSWFMGSTRW